MINAIGNITGIVSVSQTLNGELNKSIEYVNPITQEKTIEPTKEVQVVEPDKGYTGLSKVTVEAISDRYSDAYDYFVPSISTQRWEDRPFIRVIKKIPKIDTSQVRTFGNAFSDWVNLEQIESFETSQATEFTNCFYNCHNLKEVPLLDTSNAERIGAMFASCYTLQEVPAFDFKKVTSAGGLFQYSRSLITVPSFDFGLVTMISNAFDGCYALANFGGLTDLGRSYSTTATENNYSYGLALSQCTRLTHDSLINVINKVYDIKTAGIKAQSLILGSTNITKLTSEEIAIATNKGWNVS
jgi:hypothetical protein